MCLEIFFFFSSFISRSGSFKKLGVGNKILFQIKFFGRKANETALTRYFRKVNK